MRGAVTERLRGGYEQWRSDSFRCRRPVTLRSAIYSDVTTSLPSPSDIPDSGRKPTQELARAKGVVLRALATHRTDSSTHAACRQGQRRRGNLVVMARSDSDGALLLPTELIPREYPARRSGTKEQTSQGAKGAPS